MLWTSIGKKKSSCRSLYSSRVISYSSDLDWEGLQTLWDFKCEHFKDVGVQENLNSREPTFFSAWNFFFEAELFPHTLGAVPTGTGSGVLFNCVTHLRSFNLTLPWALQLCACPAGFNQRTQWSSSDSHFPISHLKQRGTGHASTFVIQVFFRALTTSQTPYTL